jgi:hypothetical protein
MRGRILWAVLITAGLLAACSRKDSLYIEPGKAGPAQAPKAEPVKATNATNTTAAPPKS